MIKVAVRYRRAGTVQKSLISSGRKMIGPYGRGCEEVAEAKVAGEQGEAVAVGRYGYEIVVHLAADG